MTYNKIPSVYFIYSNLFITTEVSQTVLVLEAGLEPARAFARQILMVRS